MDDLVTFNVGKNGVSEALVSELRGIIVKKGKVRVKFLKAARAGSDRNALADDLVEKTGARLSFARGNVIVLERKR
ncbi:MAG: YhbY family RNA-binding protein [Candidatus Altiarchaeota archaeon]